MPGLLRAFQNQKPRNNAIACDGEVYSSGKMVVDLTDTKRPDVMFKIKRQDWYDRLKAYVNGDMELYNKLL